MQDAQIVRLSVVDERHRELAFVEASVELRYCAFGKVVAKVLEIAAVETNGSELIRRKGAIGEIRHVVVIEDHALVEIKVVDAATHGNPFSTFEFSNFQGIAGIVIGITDVRRVVAVEDQVLMASIFCVWYINACAAHGHPAVVFQLENDTLVALRHVSGYEVGQVVIV